MAELAREYRNAEDFYAGFLLKVNACEPNPSVNVE